MDREGFRNRLKQYKKAREENPGLKYWEWKAQPAEKETPKYEDGTDQIGKKEIQWFKDWYNKRMEYAIANNRPDIVKQLESLQYNFYPESYKYSLGVDWDNSIYTGTLDPRINGTKISINDQAIKDYEKKHGVKIGGYQHPSEGIVLPSNYNSNDLLHELAHTFNYTESVTNAVNSAISDENGFVTIPKGLQNPEYWISPWEVHSRLMQFREENNIDPTKVYNEEDVKQLRKSAKDKILFEIFNDSQMMHLLNDVADNATTPTDDRLFLKNGGVVPKYEEGGEVGDNTDYRQQIINRADYVASNYNDAKDFDLNPLVYTFRKFAKDNFDRGGISNCTLSATGWIDPNDQYMSAKNIFNNPSSGYTKIDAGYALPGDLLIAKNPEKNSYHTMLIEGFNGNEPILRYSRGGHDTKENLVTGRLLSEYHELDNKQGGNHTEDHYFRYNIPNEYWLPELIVTPNKR